MGLHHRPTKNLGKLNEKTPIRQKAEWALIIKLNQKLYEQSN